MKKITLCLMALGLSFAINPIQANAASSAIATSSTASKSIDAAQAKTLLTRLHEINAMDKSNLNSSDKKDLRTEVLSIKEKLNGPGGGVYISVGALILIILLLIILL